VIGSYRGKSINMSALLNVAVGSKEDQEGVRFCDNRGRNPSRTASSSAKMESAQNGSPVGRAPDKRPPRFPTHNGENGARAPSSPFS
jgi:hypothetical protein